MTDLPTPKHPWFEKFRKSLLYLIIFVGGILTHFFYQQQTITTNSQGVNVEQKVENKVFNESEESSKTLAEQNKCVSKNFDKDQWNRQRFQEENGFWCPKESFTDPVMWLQEGFSLEQSSFSIEYEIKKGEKDFGKPPSFVLEYALKKDISKKVSDETITPIYKLWTPEGETLQLFRFSKNYDYSNTEVDLNKLLTPEEAYTLSSPVKVGNQTDKMTIFLTGKNGNELILNFSYNYTDLILGKGLLDTITKTVKLPVSDVTTTKEVSYYGIGTFKGNCIRPVSYTICH